MVVNYVMQVNKNLTGTENQSELYFPNQHRLYKLSINRLKKKKRNLGNCLSHQALGLRQKHLDQPKEQ